MSDKYDGLSIIDSNNSLNVVGSPVSFFYF